MVGVIHDGCQMEADIFTPFYTQDGWVTLVLDRNHANFQTADDIAKLILEQMESQGVVSGGNAEQMVRAIDAANIKVRIPEMDAGDPVGFVAVLLESRIEEPEPESRVVVNSRAGTIVISGEVEIGDVLVTHKNITVETIASPSFAALDPDESNKARLDLLVNQLNALKVPPEDMIEIIRGIERNGKLHGQLIIDR
jgi:flagellar P-ring protein precursor FlgI